MPLSNRLAGLKTRGELGSAPQFKNTKGRLLADLPANVQLKAIGEILAGKDLPNAFVNNFVRRGAAAGKTPEQIRQSFIAEQKTSSNPLMLL